MQSRSKQDFFGIFKFDVDVVPSAEKFPIADDIIKASTGMRMHEDANHCGHAPC